MISILIPLQTVKWVTPFQSQEYQATCPFGQMVWFDTKSVRSVALTMMWLSGLVMLDDLSKKFFF